MGGWVGVGESVGVGVGGVDGWVWEVCTQSLSSSTSSPCRLLYQSPRCKTCSSEPHIKSSDHLFLDLSQVWAVSSARSLSRPSA